MTSRIARRRAAALATAILAALALVMVGSPARAAAPVTRVVAGAAHGHGAVHSDRQQHDVGQVASTHVHHVDLAASLPDDVTLDAPDGAFTARSPLVSTSQNSLLAPVGRAPPAL